MTEIHLTPTFVDRQAPTKCASDFDESDNAPSHLDTISNRHEPVVIYGRTPHYSLQCGLTNSFADTAKNQLANKQDNHLVRVATAEAAI